MVSVPVREPRAVGVNTTWTVQLLPVAMAGPQLFVCEKSPVICSNEIESGAVPVFLITTACAALAIFTAWDGKLKEVAERLTPGLVPTPLNCTL
jgi:hypothetical protein